VGESTTVFGASIKLAEELYNMSQRLANILLRKLTGHLIGLFQWILEVGRVGLTGAGEVDAAGMVPLIWPVNSRLAVPEWRNWYTHQAQNLARFTPHVGSSPTSGTKLL
jgi:hypothetical protein